MIFWRGTLQSPEPPGASFHTWRFKLCVSIKLDFRNHEHAQSDVAEHPRLAAEPAAFPQVVGDLLRVDRGQVLRTDDDLHAAGRADTVAAADVADSHSEVDGRLENGGSGLDDASLSFIDENHRGHENLGAFLTDQTSTSPRFPASPDEELWSGRVLVPEELFGRRSPLEIELGTGKARFLIEAARADADHDFLGVERSLSYYRLSRNRIARSAVTNARIIRADARLFVTSVAPESVRAFHIYFPDPWPKKRQRKRRLLDGVFLEILASRLERGGLLRIVTDHHGYAEELSPLLQTVSGLEEVDWDRVPAPPATHYEIKYRAEGRLIRRFLLRKPSSDQR